MSSKFSWHRWFSFSGPLQPLIKSSILGNYIIKYTGGHLWSVIRQYQMTREINGPHLFNNIAGSLRWRRGADGGNKKAEQQLKQTRDTVPGSCRHFSTHWIRRDKGSPTGGPNAHSSLEPFISLHHKAGSAGFCHADGCLFYRGMLHSS